MANQLLTPQQIANESLDAFHNELPFVMSCNGPDENYTRRFGKEGAKIGDTLTLRRTVVFEADEGPEINQFQDVIEPPVPLVVEKQFKVPFLFSDKDLALTVDDFRARYIVPAVRALAQKVEAYAIDKAYKGIANSVGTAATVPNGDTGIETYLSAGSMMDDYATPVNGIRNMMMTPAAQVKMILALKGLFQDATSIAKQNKTGRLGTTMGFEWWMSQLLRRHTVGAYAGSGVTSSAGQTGSSVATSGWTAGAAILNQGDVISFGGVKGLNPLSFDALTNDKHFTVAANVVADGAGLATIPLVQPIVTSGPQRNVNGAPANGAAITVYGASGASSPQLLAWHPAAFGFAAPPLEDVSGYGAWCARSIDNETGTSIRITRQYDARKGVVITRLECLAGFVVRNPNMACRIWS